MIEKNAQEASNLEGALNALEASELREMLREVLLTLNNRDRDRFASEIVNRAARGRSGWRPQSRAVSKVAEISSFAEGARSVGEADPHDVTAYLQEGQNAFLRCDYRSARDVFRALLIPVVTAEIYVGQDEEVSEILGIDVSDCGAQYVVAQYMLCEPSNRASVVMASLDEVRRVLYCYAPLEEMERIAREPLDRLEEFLPDWRAFLEKRVHEEQVEHRVHELEGWLIEAVRRDAGLDGLRDIARQSKSARYLQEWCRDLVKEQDWTAVKSAYLEASQFVTDCAQKSEFLDGAALAAQELSHDDFASLLKLAWQGSPTFGRLIRWIGQAKTREELIDSVMEASQECPKDANRQRALLCFIRQDFLGAAKLLADAPGLGWSDAEHPGHLLVSLFCKYFIANAVQRNAHLLDGIESKQKSLFDIGWSMEARAKLETPKVKELIKLAAIKSPIGTQDRTSVLEAMQQATHKRARGTTRKARRSYYSHVAQLAAACAAMSPMNQPNNWVTHLRAEFRQYPALQREFDTYLGPRGL